MHNEVLTKLKIFVWELDINSLTMHHHMPDSIESVNFLSWQEQVHSQDRDFVVNQILDTINEKRTSFDCQFRLQGKDSRWLWFRMRGLPISASLTGKFSRLSGVLEEFSVYDAKIQETQRHLSYLEVKGKEKNDYFASITHELRTPMSGVVGLADLVLDSEGLSKDNRSLILSIRECGLSLLTLVNDILDFSKLEARKLTLVPVRFALQKLISDIELLFSAKIQGKNQTFVSIIEKDVPQMLVTDPNRLQQILINLIGNALKFTPYGGGICLRAELLSSSEDRASLLFSVIDSGVGIKSENQQAIFDEYSQESDQIAQQYGGTGLGLSIARQLVNLFGGSLSVRSEPGRGTVFQFDIQVGFSRDDFNTPIMSREKFDVGDGKQLRILLAEDNLVNQKVASRILEKAGHRVTLAINGEEALRIFKAESFDLVLMDIQMPILSGDQVTKMIREYEKSEGAPSIPIVALTAHAMSGDREKYLAMGMNDYVTKPIERELLFGAIDKCMAAPLTKKCDQ